jgi:benzoate membrane transport protein
VGFFGSVALVLEAARAVGADADQATSWVVALCVAVAVTTLYLSRRHRMPIVTAWSTPGAAVIAAGGAGVGINEAVGAFIVAALLVVATAMVRPFAQLVERIPKTLAAAMLAGILLPFCLDVALQIPVLPVLVLLLVTVFFLVQVWSLALPLYIVTMASQNLAGLAVLKADGYSPSARSCFGSTGVVSLLATPFGGHGVCLAAITAAICTGPAVDPDSDRRWRVGPVYALCYLVFAVFSESMVELLLALPAALITTFVGLALFGPLVGSVKTALAGGGVETKAAVVTFIVAASGVTFAGVGAAPWSLAAGLAILGLHRLFDRPKAARR